MLFFKGLNIEKNQLIRKFDINSKTYYYAKLENGNFIPIDYEQLDKKSQKKLLQENRELLTNQDLLMSEINKVKSVTRFNYLKSLGYVCDSFEYLGTIKGTISNGLNQYLDTLLAEEDVLIGIHRVGDNFDNTTMNDIFSNGLKITGHMDSLVSSNKLLKDNVSYYASNKVIKKELMHANGYKASKGSILIRIPDTELEKNKDILLITDTEVRLNPKYIIGYVPIYENNHLENIIYNQNYLKEIQNEIPIKKSI